MRFARPGSAKKVNDIRFSFRWGTFVERILSCTIGLVISSERELENIITDIMDNPREAYIVLNKKKKEVVLLSERVLG
ncbi:MAG: hypothetical protein IPI64_06870 [Chloracidobacterium sp.]|nr:hypothetical protein [Chloracidobacterium sp.]